jgi:Mn2+/Fe2+ NRAMP family transporter
MGEFVNPWWVKLLGWGCTVLIIGLNLWLLLGIAGFTGGNS